MDWSSREMVDTFSSDENEVDIVGEGEIDDVEKELHMDIILPPIHVEPIDECSELS